MSISEDNERIWVLGGKASGADRSIHWQESIPNLSNSDRLIIDLGTVPTDIAIPRYEIRDYLRYMMMAKKTIYVLLSSTSVKDRGLSDMLPVFPKLNKIKPCDFDSTKTLTSSPVPDEIDEYCNYIENCSFFMDKIFDEYLRGFLNPKNNWGEKYPFSDKIVYIIEELVFEIRNVSRQSIGKAVKYSLLDSRQEHLHETGQIIFLPPPTKITSTEAVEVLVNSLIGMELREDEPSWATKMKLPNVDKIEKQISEENKLVERATEKIRILAREKNEIENHKKLLWIQDLRVI
jgi:hypothetical protein